jgi:hypothetical protein
MVIDEESVLVSEHLPPSGILARDSSQVVAVTIVLDVHDIVLPLLISYCLRDAIECEFLSKSVLDISLENNVSASLHLNNSVHW